MVITSALHAAGPGFDPQCDQEFFLAAAPIKVSMLLQALCFMAGANSIFDGDKLLTTPNNERNEDLEMFETLGLTSRPAFMPYAAGGASSSGAPTQPDEAQQLQQAVAAA